MKEWMVFEDDQNDGDSAVGRRGAKEQVVNMFVYIKALRGRPACRMMD